jgi:hypothetical protein
MRNRLLLAVPALLIFLLTGCSRAANEAIARQAANSGVYALTATGLVEISGYGAASLDPFSQEITFKFDRTVPQVTAPLGFVANLPGAAMDESQVFLLPSLAAGRWHRHITPASDSKPVPSDVSAISGSIFKVSPDLPKAPSGFLCLWVKMSATEDRLYALQLK